MNTASDGIHRSRKESSTDAAMPPMAVHTCGDKTLLRTQPAFG